MTDAEGKWFQDGTRKEKTAGLEKKNKARGIILQQKRQQAIQKHDQGIDRIAQEQKRESLIRS